ncbi:MAG: helix-turn-helix transcriptional regulator [Peptostreptococcaceae bacterium]
MRYNLKLARMKKKMSQEEVCEKANISRSTLSKLELGKIEAKESLMIKLANILDVPVEEIFFQ